MGWLDEWEKGWLTEGIMQKEVVRVLVGAGDSKESTLIARINAVCKFPTEAESARIVRWIGIFTDELMDVPTGNPLDNLYQAGAADAVRGGGNISSSWSGRTGLRLNAHIDTRDVRWVTPWATPRWRTRSARCAMSRHSSCSTGCGRHLRRGSYVFHTSTQGVESSININKIKMFASLMICTGVTWTSRISR